MPCLIRQNVILLETSNQWNLLRNVKSHINNGQTEEILNTKRGKMLLKLVHIVGFIYSFREAKLPLDLRMEKVFRVKNEDGVVFKYQECSRIRKVNDPHVGNKWNN